MGDPDTLPILPLRSKEIETHVGQMSFQDGRAKMIIVDPAGTKRYVTMLIGGDSMREWVFWMEREDLTLLKRLLDKAMTAADAGEY